MDRIEQKQKMPTAIEIALEKAGISQAQNSRSALQTAKQPTLWATQDIAVSGQSPALPQAVSSSGVRLGRVLEDGKPTGRPITLGGVEQFSGLHVMALPRYGKSSFLVNLFLHYASLGHGAAYLDPHHNSIQDCLARLPLHREKDVVILDPARETHSFGLNLLSCDNPKSDLSITYSYNQLWSVFTKLYANEEGEMGIWLEKFVSNSLLALLEHADKGYTICDISRMLTDKPFREYIASTLRNHVVAEFWLKEYPTLSRADQAREIESTKTRLNLFLSHTIIRSIVGQVSTVDFREITDTKKLLLIHTPRAFPDDLKKLLYTTLLTRLLHTMFSRSDTPRDMRVPFYLICDEVENYAIDEFSSFFEEGGKYGFCVIAAHQSLFQRGMTDTVRNSLLTAGNKVYGRLNDRDAEIVAPGYAQPPEEKSIPTAVPREVLQFLKYHQHPFVRRIWARILAPFDQALEGEGIRHEKDVFHNFLGDRIVEKETIYPEWDFGSGNMEFDPKVVRKMRLAWNELLFEAMQQELPQDKMDYLKLKVIIGMSEFLDFYSYVRYMYDDAWKDVFMARADRKEVDRYERVKELLSSFLQSDTGLMRFFQAFEAKPDRYNGRNTYQQSRAMFHGDYPEFNKSSMMAHKQPDPAALPTFLRKLQQKPEEEAKQFFNEQLKKHRETSTERASIQTYLNLLRQQYLSELVRQFPPDKCKKDKEHDAYMIEYFRNRKWWGFYDYFYKYYGRPPDFLDRLCKSGYVKTIEAGKRMRYERNIDLSQKSDRTYLRFKVHCPLTEARDGLADDKSFLLLLSKRSDAAEVSREAIRSNYWWDNPWHNDVWPTGNTISPENLGKVLSRECSELYSFHEPRDTREKLLAIACAALEKEIAAMETRLKPLYAEYNKKLSDDQEQRDQRKAEQKSRFDRFVSELEQLLNILKQPEYKILVPVSNYDYQPRREKTERDMIDTAARELRNLHKYQAFCKIVEGDTTAVYHIALPELPPVHPEAVVRDLTERIWIRMEQEYYKPKAEIEAEIIRRRTLPSPAPEMSAFVKLPVRPRKQENGASNPANR